MSCINLNVNMTTPSSVCRLCLYVPCPCASELLFPALALTSASCWRDIKFPSFFFQKQIPPTSAPVSRRLLRHQTAEPSIWTQRESSLFPAEPDFIYRRSAAFLDLFGAALLNSQFYYPWQKNPFTADVYGFVLMTPLAAFCSLGNCQRGTIEALARKQMIG